MNRYMRMPTVGALTVMMALTTAAWAGAKGGANVAITFSGDNGTASGTMGTVRNSSDTLQYIGCAVYAYDSEAQALVYCSARNTSNVTVSCTSTAHELVSLAHAMTSDAHVSFSWNGSGACTALTIRTDSRYPPKSP